MPGSAFGDLDYAFHDAFDPTALARLGSLATVHVAGSETEPLRTAVIADVVAQAVSVGAGQPTR